MVWALHLSTRELRKDTRDRRSSSEGSVISWVPRRATTTGMISGRKRETSGTVAERLREILDARGESSVCVCACVCMYVCVHVYYVHM